MENKNDDFSDVMIPYVEFADQTRYVVPVDNSSCFIYGLEEVDSGNVGVEFRVLLKYYINDRYAVNTQNVITSGTMRVLYHEYKIKVVEKPPTSISKLSVLPIWRQYRKSFQKRCKVCGTARRFSKGRQCNRSSKQPRYGYGIHRTQTVPPLIYSLFFW